MFKRSLFQCSLFVFAFSLCSSAFALDFGTVTAVRDRSDANQVILTLNFTSVTPADDSALGVPTSSVGEVQQAMANFLDICLPATTTQTACGETDIKVLWGLGRQPVPQTGIYVSTTQSAAFPNNGTIVTTDTQDVTIHAYQIAIAIRDSAAAIPVGQRILLRLYPDKISSNGNKDKLDIVVKLGSGVADAVEAIGAFPTPVSLIAAWQNKRSVTFVDGTTGTPGGVVGVLIPDVANSANTAIPAITYVSDPAAGAPAAASCSVSTEGLDTSAPTCSVSCSPNVAVTLDVNSLASSGFRSASTTNLADASIGFGDLTVAGGPYAIVLQYIPEGTAFSCVVGSPSDAATLIQIEDGPAPKSGDPSCFIATAAYGSALDPHIDVLRWFRDTYLLKTAWGKSFVRSYYRNSPPVADWIREHSWARSLTRGALWAPVLALETFRDHRSFAISALILAGVAVIVLRRRLA